MFSGYLQDFSRMFSRCSDGSCGPGGFWRSFQMKVWTLMVQRNSMITSYLLIPGIRWSPAIRWSIGSMDFDNRKVYGDSSIYGGLVKHGYDPPLLNTVNKTADLAKRYIPNPPGFSGRQTLLKWTQQEQHSVRLTHFVDQHTCRVVRNFSKYFVFPFGWHTLLIRVHSPICTSVHPKQLAQSHRRQQLSGFA